MQSNYKRLGDYIKEVKVRNTDLAATELLGVNIDKFFMPSVANIVGTDMSVYKIVKRGQFACNRMHVGRDMRLPVALSDKDYEFMVSPAYDVFEIKDTAKLLPEYLMMWFTRKEFDRNAWFYTDADVRGGLNWKALCDMKLPIPSPEKQRQLVNEYHVLVDRINLNNRLIQKLEETAQAVYKQWFVDFEFPDANGKPYKSNGGEMEYSSTLGKEVPKHWDVKLLKEYVTLSQGLVMNATTNHLISETGIPLLRITDLINDTKKIFISELVPIKNIATKEDIIYTRTGQVGLVFRNKEGVVYNNCFKVNPINKKLSKDYLFWYLKQKETYNLMVELAAGSAQSDLSHTTFYSVFILAPSTLLQARFSNAIIPIESMLNNKNKEIKLLENVEELLLSKIATIEN